VKYKREETINYEIIQGESKLVRKVYLDDKLFKTVISPDTREIDIANEVRIKKKREALAIKKEKIYKSWVDAKTTDEKINALARAIGFI